MEAIHKNYLVKSVLKWQGKILIHIFRSGVFLYILGREQVHIWQWSDYTKHPNESVPRATLFFIVFLPAIFPAVFLPSRLLLSFLPSLLLPLPWLTGYFILTEVMNEASIRNSGQYSQAENDSHVLTTDIKRWQEGRSNIREEIKGQGTTRKSKNNDEGVIWLGVVALRRSVCKE